jgi:hypothetical protein
MSSHIHSSSDDNDNDDYRLPSATRKRSGWAGEEMELEHHRQRQGATGTGASNNDCAAVAVDLNQFRNTVVGSGYQAKGVIRQSSHNRNTNEIINLSDPKKAVVADKSDDGSLSSVDKKKRKRSSKRRKKEESKSRSKSKKSGSEMNAVTEKYLQCKGIRAFRKEIEKILQEAT